MTKRSSGWYYCEERSRLKHVRLLRSGEEDICLGQWHPKSPHLKQQLPPDVLNNILGARVIKDAAESYFECNNIAFGPSLVKSLYIKSEEREDLIAANIMSLEAYLAAFKDKNQQFCYELLKTSEDVFQRLVCIMPYAKDLAGTHRLIGLDAAHMKPLLLTSVHTANRRMQRKLKLAALTTKMPDYRNVILAFSLSHHEGEEDYAHLLSFVCRTGLNLNVVLRGNRYD